MINDKGQLHIPVAPVFRPLLKPSRCKGAYGGRASGKSEFFADLAIMNTMREKCDIICIRETQLSLGESVKKLIESKIEDHGLARDYNVLQSHIECKVTGSRIGFQGMQNHTAESIKSLHDYRVAWFEEAQSSSQRSLDLLRPTIRVDGPDGKGVSELWFSWNPYKATDPVDMLLRGDVLPPRSIVVKANYRDNPWLPQSMKEEIVYDRSRDIDRYAHVWLGEYLDRSESRVFKNWKVEEFERPAGTIFRLGADWGYSIDPSVLVRCSAEGNVLYIDHEAYMIGCEIVNLPDLFRRVPESEKWFITADSARPETISYMQKHGFPKMNYALKGKNSIKEGIEFMQSYDIVVHPRCVNVIEELSTFSYKTDPHTGQVMPIMEDRKNHTIDSIRYALEGARRGGMKPTDKAEKKVTHYSEHAWMGA